MNSPYWFELAVMFGLVCIGNIVLAPFASDVPKWRRVAKMFIGGGVAALVSATAGREWFFAVLGATTVFFVIIHAWWLPRNGVNGLTAEPRERYRELRGWKAK